MHRKSYTPQEIIKGFIESDIKIYRYIYNRFHKQVIQYVCKNSGKKEDGEELFNDVVFTIYLKIEEEAYSPVEGTFDGYFMKITKNMWLNELRKKKINTIAFEEAKEVKEESNDDKEQEIISTYTKLVFLVKKHIALLDEPDKILIESYYFGREKIKTIVPKLRLSSEAAVKQKLYRIRKKLKDSVESDPEYDPLMRSVLKI